MLRKAIFLSSMLLLLSGCRTGVILKETPLNLSETRKAIVTVIGEPRTMNSTGREMYSKFYDKKNNHLDRMDGVKERFFTLVTILGDRRPYDLQVEVMVEHRDDRGKFQIVGKDEAKALPIADKIKKALNESLGNRNIIDDFRSF